MTKRARASPYRTNAAADRRSLDGTPHIVVPVIGIVEGVLNDELVLRTEFAHHVEAWNGRPVTLRHPHVDGSVTSANSPSATEAFRIGTLYGAHLHNDRLRAELWIDESKARSLGADGVAVLQRLLAGTPTEVSTGYFRDLDPTPGVWDGTPYFGIARSIKPDHIAILPHETGACSVQDGCGTPRTNTKEGPSMTERKGFQARIGALFDRVRANQDEQSPTLDVLEEAVTQAYEGQHDEEPGVEAEATTPETAPAALAEAHPTEPGTQVHTEEPVRNDKITSIISNSLNAFDEADREWLDSHPDAALTKLDTIPPTDPAAAMPDAPATDEPTTNTDNDSDSLGVDGILEQLGIIGTPEAARFIQNAVTKQRQHREALIQQLTSNVKKLETSDVESLTDDAIASLTEATQPHDYSGMGTPNYHTNTDDDTVPESPSVIMTTRESN